MGRLLMILTTLLIIVVIIVRNINNKKLFELIKYNISEINNQYKNLFKEKSFKGKILQSGLLILAQIFMSVTIITSIWKYVDTYLNDALDIIVKLILIIIFIVSIYLAIGYILLTTSRVYKVIYNVEDKNIKVDLILSYFLLSMYFTILLVFPRQFEESYIIGLIGVVICYVLNLKVLIKVIKNPQHIRNRNQEKVSFSGIAIVSVIILSMIILNLFLAVCFINYIGPNMYSGNENNFDLFYYTIITFTTVGYGDIVPVSIIAKVMSIIISSTSVICITIFLSSVLSYKDSEG